jgi:hypothetical protein
MLPQQVLAVVVAVRRAHHRVEVGPRGPVGRVDRACADRPLMIEFGQDDRGVDAVRAGCCAGASAPVTASAHRIHGRAR